MIKSTQHGHARQGGTTMFLLLNIRMVVVNEVETVADAFP